MVDAVCFSGNVVGLSIKFAASKKNIIARGRLLLENPTVTVS